MPGSLRQSVFGSKPIAALLVLTCCSPMSARSDPPPSAVPLPDRIQGANLRPVGDARRGYGTRTARATLERLRGMGVNTIGVLMEGRMKNVGDPNVRSPSERDLEAVRQMLKDANQLGFATILVPHLYLDDGSWRGDIRFEGDDDTRARWWRSYARFLLTAADVASSSGTTALSIGVELKGLSPEVETRRVMQELANQIRSRFAGLLLYSANWDEAEQVAFWSVVDVAGVNGYYPLVPDPVRGAEMSPTASSGCLGSPSVRCSWWRSVIDRARCLTKDLGSGPKTSSPSWTKRPRPTRGPRCSRTGFARTGCAVSCFGWFRRIPTIRRPSRGTGSIR
ncbi:MAG: hypothetical protein HC923_02705 [Myxococcales bacterium]|nr:hypothetical protein [Myxococcales bacterium]